MGSAFKLLHSLEFASAENFGRAPIGESWKEPSSVARFLFGIISTKALGLDFGLTFRFGEVRYPPNLY